MAIATEDHNKEVGDQYNAAFAEDAAPAAGQSEDDAFGITPPAEAVSAAEADEPAGADGAAAEAGESAPEAGDTAGQADQSMGADGESATQESAEAEDPKEVQRLKSWEGRLKKLEAELLAKKQSPNEKAGEIIEEVGETAEEQGNQPLSEEAEQLGEQVEDGAMTLDQAMRQLTEDFGEPFVKMIEAIASAKAGDVGAKAASGVQQDVKDIIDHISSSAEKAHFQAIAKACPDFNDIRQDPAFEAFLQSNPDAQKVASSGSADEVIQMIQQFKDSSAAPEPAAAAQDAPSTPDAGQSSKGADSADAAAGVRSGGLRLPDEPAPADDYAGAFDEAAKTR